MELEPVYRVLDAFVDHLHGDRKTPPSPVDVGAAYAALAAASPSSDPDLRALEQPRSVEAEAAAPGVAPRRVLADHYATITLRENRWRDVNGMSE